MPHLVTVREVNFGGKMPVAANLSRSVRAVTSQAFAVLALTTWLTLLLLCSAWTRPIGETALVWVYSLPLFLLLDFVRHKAAPDRAVYFAWLHPALAAARRGESYPSMAGRSLRLLVCYGPLALLAAYIVAFIFFPEVRAPSEAVDQMRAASSVYGIIGAWYPAAANQPAHIIALGHPREAEDLRHFITAVLIFSLGLIFVAAGPGRRELAEWWLLKRIRLPVERGGREPNARRLVRIALGQALIGGSVLAMFAIFSIPSADSKVYWRLEAFPPCLMFMLSSYLLSTGIAAVGVLNDAACPGHEITSPNPSSQRAR